MSETATLALDKLSMRTFDADGRMHVELCNISKATVNEYYGREIPNSTALGLEPDQLYKLYRHPDELAAGAASFANLQLLMTHIGVNAEDPKLDLTVGTIGSDVRFEEPYLKASLAVWTKEAIALIESKAQAQLSCSYRYRADMTPGVTSSGIAFDGVMRDIIGNHVALVEEGRAGPDVLVADSTSTGLLPMNFKFPKLAAALKALIPTVKDEQLLAFDSAASEEMEAKDAFESKEEEEKKAKDAKEAEEKAAADKKARDEEEEAKAKKEAEDKARDEAAGVKPGPSEGEKGAALDASIKKAEDRAVARVEALHVARDEVKPLVGVVAMDSAEAVYKFALDKSGVSIEGVHPSAFRALVKAELRTRARPATPVFATDAANSVGLDAVIPGVSRIKQG